MMTKAIPKQTTQRMTRIMRLSSSDCGESKSPSGSHFARKSVVVMHSSSRSLNSLRNCTWKPYLKIEISLNHQSHFGMLSWLTKKPAYSSMGTMVTGVSTVATYLSPTAVPIM